MTNPMRRIGGPSSSLSFHDGVVLSGGVDVRYLISYAASRAADRLDVHPFLPLHSQRRQLAMINGKPC